MPSRQKLDLLKPLKLAPRKTTDFQILTRQHRLREPTDVAESLYSVGVDLLNHVDYPGAAPS